MTMRISSQNTSATLMHNYRQNNAQMSKLAQQSYTGKSIQVPSDNPVASTRLVQLQREQAAINQYQSNITRLSGSLSMQESHVSSLGDVLLSMKDKLLAANNASNSQEDVAAYGQELESLLETMVASMNAKNEDGHYLFGGTRNDIEAVVYDSANQTYKFQGNTSERQTVVGNGINIKDNVNLSGVFSENGSDMELLNQLKSLTEKMRDPDTNLSSFQGELSDVIGKMSGAIDKNSALLSELGGRQNRLTLMEDTHEGVKIANQGVIGGLEDADPAELYINLNSLLTTMQAANNVYGKISKLSIFDVI